MPKAKAANFRDFERDNEDVKKAEHLKLPLERIKKRPGFNPRNLKKPATIEKIASMQVSYEEGKFVPHIIVRLATDGKHVEIVEGECRYTAAVAADKKLRSEGKPGIDFLEVIKFTGDDKAALTLAFKSSEGEGLTPLEQSNAVTDFQKMGLNREQIAKELDKSIGWIDRLIVIAKLPANIKLLVEADKVAPETAVKIVKEHGDGAEAFILSKLKGAAADTSAKGEEKVTAKHTKPKAEAKAPRKQVDANKYQAALTVAFNLPDKITRARNIVPDKTYEISISGAALQALLDLQTEFTPEIEAELAAEKEREAAGT